jgi:hypothetical protein
VVETVPSGQITTDRNGRTQIFVTSTFDPSFKRNRVAWVSFPARGPTLEGTKLSAGMSVNDFTRSSITSRSSTVRRSTDSDNCDHGYS